MQDQLVLLLTLPTGEYIEMIVAVLPEAHCIDVMKAIWSTWSEQYANFDAACVPIGEGS